MKTLICVIFSVFSFSVLATVTCTTGLRTESGLATISKKVVTGTYFSASGLTSDLTKLYEARGRKYFAATRETRDGTEILIAYTMPASHPSTVHVIKTMALDAIRLTDGPVLVSCSKQ